MNGNSRRLAKIIPDINWADFCLSQRPLKIQLECVSRIEIDQNIDIGIISYFCEFTESKGDRHKTFFFFFALNESC